jgi:hypothetical protein
MKYVIASTIGLMVSGLCGIIIGYSIGFGDGIIAGETEGYIEGYNEGCDDKAKMEIFKKTH